MAIIETEDYIIILNLKCGHSSMLSLSDIRIKNNLQLLDNYNSTKKILFLYRNIYKRITSYFVNIISKTINICDLTRTCYYKFLNYDNNKIYIDNLLENKQYIELFNIFINNLYIKYKILDKNIYSLNKVTIDNHILPQNYIYKKFKMKNKYTNLIEFINIDINNEMKKVEEYLKRKIPKINKTSESDINEIYNFILLNIKNNNKIKNMIDYIYQDDITFFSKHNIIINNLD